jgi:hypothetical protein
MQEEVNLMDSTTHEEEKFDQYPELIPLVIHVPIAETGRSTRRV